MTTLRADGLSAGYRGKPVVSGLELAYGPGIHVVLGPNGAGKTTTFRTLTGVLPPLAGRVTIDGRNPYEDVAAKGLVGVCTHRSPLAARLSVADNLRYWGRIAGMPARRINQRLTVLLDVLDLREFAGKTGSTLSRGQAQRAGLARALLASPPVLVLDEPSAGLDPLHATALRDHLRGLAEAGTTLVVSSHTLSEAMELADDVTMLHRGRMIARGTPDELRTQVVGGRLRLRIRGSGDLAGILSRHGYLVTPAPAGSGFLVEVEDETAVEKLVTAAVRDGAGIREVAPAGNPLEEVYRELVSPRPHKVDGAGASG